VIKKIASLLILGVMVFPFYSTGAESINLTLEPYVKSFTRTGQLNFFRTYQYSFKSSGEVSKLNVDVGEQFKKGALLASVDTDDLSSELNQLLAEKAFVNQEVRRLSRLAKVDAVSASEVEQYKSRSSQLKARIIRVREYLDASSIVAPYDGVVLTRNVDLGEFVGPGQMVLTVAPVAENLVIQVSVTEQELSEFRLGQEVTVQDTLLGRSLPAKVKQIATTPNMRTGLFQIDLSIAPTEHMSIGKLFDVHVTQQTELVFKVPNQFAKVDFNKTALIQIVDDNNKHRLKRFRVIDFDLEYIYVNAEQLTRLTAIK